MKALLLLSLSLSLLLLPQFATAREVIIPPELNKLLAKATPGMSINEFKKIAENALKPIFFHPGDWSGWSGYFDCKVNETLSFSVSARDVLDENGERIDQVLTEEVRFYIYYFDEKLRIELTQFRWDEHE